MISLLVGEDEAKGSVQCYGNSKCEQANKDVSHDFLLFSSMSSRHCITLRAKREGVNPLPFKLSLVHQGFDVVPDDDIVVNGQLGEITRFE